ncbi:MAG: nitrogenase-associated protein [Chromatiaceae bacterium]|nr:MAG: nitrogenase-associated protein [Chromatiaceae bacterium]
MTHVVFYEKPGCITNARQKQLLVRHGHLLLVRDLLRERWSAARLRPFLAGLPVADWFNPAAPRIRSGEIDPTALAPGPALELLLADPLLIRRPLLETPHGCCAGFVAGPVLAALGVLLPPDQDLQSCARPEATRASSEPTRDGSALDATTEMLARREACGR